jgi:hypothetical protein
MASKPFSESYKGCTINAHNHGYTITGALINVVDNQQRVATSVLTGEEIKLPGPSSDSLTWMQAAKLWIDSRG